MARFEMAEINNIMAGGDAPADILCDIGLMYATGRNCELDMVTAHKWLNIAAIKGSERAAALRSELAHSLSKPELAKALKLARQWMTMH